MGKDTFHVFTKFGIELPRESEWIHITTFPLLFIKCGFFLSVEKLKWNLSHQYAYKLFGISPKEH